MSGSGNLFADLPPATDEVFEELLRRPGVRLERIVSRGHVSPPGFWYDQVQDEWVLLLAGGARLRFEDEPQPLELSAGDHVFIAAHRRHRVEWTDPQRETVWLALHLDPA